MLIYGTGGLAYGGVTPRTSIFGGNTGLNLGLCCRRSSLRLVRQLSDTLVGWTVGGGVEWMFMPNWSAKVEYLYYDLGSVTYSGAPPSSLRRRHSTGHFASHRFADSTRFNGNVVRVGVNYHFNWGAPAPVVAKY